VVVRKKFKASALSAKERKGRIWRNFGEVRKFFFGSFFLKGSKNQPK